MKTLLPAIVLSSLAGLAHADDIQFAVSGLLYPTSTTPQNAGAPASTFTMSFDVDTMDPANTLTLNANSFAGGTLQSLAFSVVATDFTVTLDGQTIESGGTGTFSATGSGLGPCNFIGGGYSASSSMARFGGIPDFDLAGGACISQAQLMGSSDPLGLLLSNAAFTADDGWGQSYFASTGAMMDSTVTVVATSVPEPSPLVLMGLGFGLLFIVRRRER